MLTKFLIGTKDFLFDTWWKTIITWILLIALLWVAASFYLLSQTSTLVFNNTVSWAPVPNIGFEQNYVRNSKNENISLAYFPNSNKKEVILYLHGNAGRINDFFKDLTAQANVLSPAYTGYHESEGDPTPEKVYETARLAYDWLVNVKGYKENQITILGHSLGGSPSTYLASIRPQAKRLVLINTFSSIQSMCFRSYTILCGFTGGVFNSAENAKKVEIPVRQFGYKNDLTVPFEEGKTLYTYFEKSPDKKFIELDEFTHTFPNFKKVFAEVSFS
jgi:pimeloyl-ACP methyl ester carboxylesterase